MTLNFKNIDFFSLYLNSFIIYTSNLYNLVSFNENLLNLMAEIKLY